MPRPRRIWDFTGEALDVLLARLDPDRETACQRYILLQDRLITFFEGRGCRDPEGLAIKSLDRTVMRVMERDEHIDSVESYALGVCRYVAQEHWKEVRRERAALKELASHSSPSEPLDCVASAERQAELKEAIGRLPRKKRVLLKGYYAEGRTIENRKRLARRWGLTDGALRLRILSIRNDLRKILPGQ